jgi:hypothetical protein
MKAIAILIRNRHIIRLHKYGKITFNFLNKHFYFVSLLSLIAKAKNNKLYKITSWIIKLILVINIFISSGLFFTVVDLTTPLSAIYNFYDNLLGPYIDMITDKLNSLSNLQTKVETEYINSSKFKSNSLKDSILEQEPVEVEQSNKVNSYLKIAYLALATACFLYVTLYLPGPSIDPVEIDKYNKLNQLLINSKISIKEIIDAVRLLNNVGPFTEVLPPVRNDIEMTIIDAESVISSPTPSSSNLTLPQVTETSSGGNLSDSGSEGSNESSESSSTLKGKEVASVNPLSTSDKATQISPSTSN